SPGEFAQLVLSAPPMTGGEYISTEALKNIWQQLNQWVNERINQSGDISSFLTAYAPKWQQVGKVCFHLAENKKNEDFPFAFLATYASGLTSDGKVRHTPLGKALKQYADSRHKQALIKLLSPVNQAGKKCPWVAEQVTSGKIYQSQAWTAQQAYTLL